MRAYHVASSTSTTRSGGTSRGRLASSSSPVRAGFWNSATPFPYRIRRPRSSAIEPGTGGPPRDGSGGSAFEARGGLLALGETPPGLDAVDLERFDRSAERR